MAKRKILTEAQKVDVALDWVCQQCLMGIQVSIHDLARVKAEAVKAHSEGRNVTEAVTAFVATLHA